MIRLVSACAAMLLLPTAALAQQNQAPGELGAGAGAPVNVVQIGAGTSAGTTTGSSGPKSKGSGEAQRKPDASLCEAYGPDVRKDCLETDLNTREQQP